MAAQSKRSASSWLQLTIFTIFLFLLVAIPYAIYLKASSPKSSVQINNLPQITITAKKTPTVTITPPPASAATTCIQVPDNYSLGESATPAAYLLTESKKEVCFPPALPPFPFTWITYQDYVNGIKMDVPGNWTEQVKTIDTYSIHNYYSDSSATTGTADLSFTVFAQDPYATDSAAMHQSITKSQITGTIYTKGNSLIVAVFPLQKGYFILQSSTADSAFYAFQHMLVSLVISR